MLLNLQEDKFRKWDLEAMLRYTRLFAQPDTNTDDSDALVTEPDMLVFVADDKPAGETEPKALRIKASDMAEDIFRKRIKAHGDFSLNADEEPQLVGCAEAIRGGA